MKKSTHALAGMVVLDLIILAGTAWFVTTIRGGTALTVSSAEAISTIASIGTGTSCWLRD